MSVRKLLVVSFLLLLIGPLLVLLGCESLTPDNWYSDTKKEGPSTAQPTGIKQLMQEMRVANIQLVDALTYMDPKSTMAASYELWRRSQALKEIQPAIALSGPNDAAQFKALADNLSQAVAQVSQAAQASQMEYADKNYASAFLVCNQCHRQFRVTMPAPEPLNVPQTESPSGPAPVPAPEVPAPGPAPVPAPEAPAPAPAPPAPAPVPGM